jgi:hypothetical protein
LLDQLHVRLVVFDIEQCVPPRAGRDWRPAECCGSAAFDYKLWCGARDQVAPEHASRTGSAFYAKCAPISSASRLVTTRPKPVPATPARLLSGTIERLE